MKLEYEDKVKEEILSEIRNFCCLTVDLWTLKTTSYINRWPSCCLVPVENENTIDTPRTVIISKPLAHVAKIKCNTVVVKT
jgi:hypothetical protein